MLNRGLQPQLQDKRLARIALQVSASQISMGKAAASLNKISQYLDSSASVRAKCKVQNSRVLPVLRYATECGNHVQADL